MAHVHPPPSITHIERNITRCRLILSAVAVIALFIDPTDSMTTPRASSHTSWFSIDSYTLAVLGAHFAYSAVIFSLLDRHLVAPVRLVAITTWADVLFGAVIAFFTEGASSPFYAFFIFAVVVTALRYGFRRTLVITAVSVVLYLGLVAVSAGDSLNFYVMRPVYLAIVGYLVAYLGQQRLNLEEEIQSMAAADQRDRIARDLHDGWAQALAGINLRIETCRELLRRGRLDEARADLAELQGGVTREYDDLRAYMRSLAGMSASRKTNVAAGEASFSISAEFKGSAELVEHVLQILREGTSNVLCHAHARSASFQVRMADGEVMIAIDDDGVGFPRPEERPWSIASRVRQLGGELRLDGESRSGAHLAIHLPVS